MRSLVLGIRLRFITARRWCLCSCCQNLFPLQERHTRSLVWHLQLDRHLEALVWSLLNLFSHKSFFQCRRISFCGEHVNVVLQYFYALRCHQIVTVYAYGSFTSTWHKPKIRAPLSVSCPWAFLTRYILLPACSPMPPRSSRIMCIAILKPAIFDSP